MKASIKHDISNDRYITQMNTSSAFRTWNDGLQSGSKEGQQAFSSAFSSQPNQERNRNEPSPIFIARQAEAARQQKSAAVVEAARIKDALAFTSGASYPSLGSGPSGKPKLPPLNFKKAVSTPLPEARSAARLPLPVKEEEIRKASSLIYYDEEEEPYMGQRDPEEVEDNEFNADLESGRRRGDKGIW